MFRVDCNGDIVGVTVQEAFELSRLIVQSQQRVEDHELAAPMHQPVES